MTAIVEVTDPGLLAHVRSFFHRSDIRGNLAFLRSRLPAGAPIYAAGGAIRNRIMEALHGGAPHTADLDLFVGGQDPRFSLWEALEDQAVEPTQLKGLRWRPADADLPFDLCRISDFVVIDVFRQAPTPENLLAGIDLNVNAVLYEVDREILLDRGCIAAIRARVVDFNSLLVPDTGLIAYRILLMAHKTGFCLAPRAFRFIRNRLDLDAATRVKGLLRGKGGDALAEAVMADYDDLCTRSTYAAYLALCQSRRAGDL